MKIILSVILIISISSCNTIYYKGSAFNPVYSTKQIDSINSDVKLYTAEEIGISSKNKYSSKKKIIGYTKREVSKGEKASAIVLLTAGTTVAALAAVAIPFYLLYIVVTNSEHPKE